MSKESLNFRKRTPEISVIIPVYDVEKYLKECLDSVVNQTFNDIEIICINDGSTDNSLKILNSYAKTDKRMKVISRENKGVGNARNTGLNVAKGKYIYFMDSDDFLELDALNELYNLIKEKSCDLIIFKTHVFIHETGEYINADYHLMPELTATLADKSFNYSEYLKDLIDVDVTVYTKFFKREAVSDIRFVEELIFEDNLFTMELIFNTQSIYFHDKQLYHRRIRENSLMTCKSEKYINNLEILNMLEELFKEKGYYKEYKEILFARKYGVLKYRLNLIDEKYKEEFFNRIKSDLNVKQEQYDKIIDFDEVCPAANKLYNNFCNSKDYDEFKKSF